MLVRESAGHLNCKTFQRQVSIGRKSSCLSRPTRPCRMWSIPASSASPPQPSLPPPIAAPLTFWSSGTPSSLPGWVICLCFPFRFRTPMAHILGSLRCTSSTGLSDSIVYSSPVWVPVLFPCFIFFSVCTDCHLSLLPRAAVHVTTKGVAYNHRNSHRSRGQSLKSRC